MTRSRDVANIDTILTTKGDIYAASAAYTPARLAVGNNGETLVADSSQSAGLRYNPPVGSLANPIINGGMDIWQRGTSVANATNQIYTADRWIMYRGTTGSTVSRQTTSDTTNLPNIQYSARVQRDSGNTSTSAIYFNTSVESVNAIPFAGKSITLSFYARAGANFSAASSQLGVQFYTGTGTDQNINNGYTGSVLLLNTAATLTTTWQRFAFNATIAATATEFAVYFPWTPVGTAGANDWYEITGVQIDVGTWTASTAPTFRRSGNTLAGELAACQRYYWRWTAGDAYTPYGMALKTTATAAQWALQFPVEMRARVTSLEFSSLISSNAAGNGAITAMTLGWWGKNTARIDITNNSIGVADTPTLIQSNNNSSAYFAINAEL